MARSLESLQAELDRIEKRLKKKRETENEKEIKYAKSRLAKAKNSQEFITLQTVATITQTISKLENQQLQLQAQIVTIQERVRYYSDLLENRDTMLADAKRAVADAETKLNRLLGKAPTVESVLDQWNSLEGLFNECMGTEKVGIK